MTDPTERMIDDLIAEIVATMARYGVNDPSDVRLSPEDYHALLKELMQLRPPWLEPPKPQKKRGRKAMPELDALIWFELNDTYPSERMARARQLAEDLSKYDNYNITVRTIYAKYYKVRDKIRRARMV